MAEGTNTFQGHGVPLAPATGFEIKQQTASTAVDIATLTAASSGTGDFLVLQTSGGTERFVVEDGGNIVAVIGAAGDVGVKVTLASAATADGLQILNSSGSKIFAVNASGAITTQALPTTAIASLASNASTSFSLAGLTTDHAVELIALKVLTTGNGILQAYAQGTTRVDVYAQGGSVAANTYAVKAYKTVAN